MRRQATCAPSGRSLHQVGAAALAAALFGLSTAVHAAAPAPPPGLLANAKFSSLQLYEYWKSQNDSYRCEIEGVDGPEIITGYNTWSRPLRIETKGRRRGCQLVLAVIDTKNVLRRWPLVTEVRRTGTGQRDGLGRQNIQLVRHKHEINRSYPMVLATDDRRGGCKVRFSLGNSGPSLLIYFQADDPKGQDQCQVRGMQEVSLKTTRSILIDADTRPGGCTLQFRLL